MGQICIASMDLGWRLALVAFGSAVGGVLRYLMSILCPASGAFPWTTLSINVIGSFVIGLTSGLIARCCGGSLAGEWIRAVAVVGFCGGFTTFSTFSNETFRLLEGGQSLAAAGYVTLSVLAGLAAVFLGYFISR